MSDVINEMEIAVDDKDKAAYDEEILKASRYIEAESSQKEAPPKMPCQEIDCINVEPLKKELELKKLRFWN